MTKQPSREGVNEVVSKHAACQPRPIWRLLVALLVAALLSSTMLARRLHAVSCAVLHSTQVHLAAKRCTAGPATAGRPH